VLSTGFLASAAKSTLAKQQDPCRRGSKNATGIYDLPIPRPLPFLNTSTRPATILSGTKASPNNINRDGGIEIPEAHDAYDQNTQQKNSITEDCCGSSYSQQ